MKRLLLVALFLLALPLQAQAADPENTVYLDLQQGRVTIELRPDLAPQSVARFKELVRKGFYNGLIFHRVEDWVAQTGDPAGTGAGGSGQTLPPEFTKAPFTRGAVGMARTDDPNSGDSQFFFVKTDADWLEGQYTLFGRVTEGMALIDSLELGTPPAFPDKIVKMSVAADEGAPAAEAITSTPTGN